MAARKKRTAQKSAGRRPLPWTSPSLLSELAAAEALIDRKRWQEALDVLDPLVRRFPGRVEVLAPMLEVAQALKERPRVQVVSEMLRNVLPDDPEVLLSLAGAYLDNARPALAAQTFHRFLERWPDHERAADARSALVGLEASLRGFLATWGIAEEDTLELAVLHEEVQSSLEQGDYPAARRFARKFLARYPHCAPVLNNVSQSFYAQGQLDEAVKTTQRVLEFAPENIHALSNLTRFLCLSGRLDEAREVAARLTASAAPATDRSYKIAESLSYLGDDAAILETFEHAQKAGELEGATTEAMFHHLAAVAALRLGREDEARRLWKRSLQASPGLNLAQDNLADLKNPVEARHGPWSFSLRNWGVTEEVRTLAAQVEAVADRNPAAAITPAVRAWARRHPRAVAIVPLLLDRGDPGGRQFALHIALALDTPEMGAVLRDFALGERGPDSMRMEASQAAVSAGLLPAGRVRLWLKGQWRDVMLMGYEIHDEPLYSHSPPVKERLQTAVGLIREGRADAGERLLREALEIEPDAPDILNNIASALSHQGRREESEALIYEIHARHPDYTFARINVALLAARRGELAQAKALLEPFLSRRRLHFSELASLAGAQIEIYLADEDWESARHWLELWESVDPDHPQLPAARQRVQDSRQSPLDVVRRLWSKA